MIQLAGAWDRGYAIHTYNNPDGGRTLLGEAIYRYQYRKQWYLVDSLARWAQSVIQANAEFKGVDLLVPVPTSRSLSDYDPTSLLVDWISQLTTIPRAVGVLARFGLISEYSDGSTEGASRGGMTVTAPEAVRGRKLLLIDGIICSGSTLHLATQALRNAGATSVSALVFTKIERQSLDSFGLTGQNS
ncbi:MAG: ComF family protein [Candidatus Sericytochromatia bacterium]|nr:ComF family protein [Candidatus Tanganyikabacteria bacterium]